MKIPKSETIMVSYSNCGGNTKYVITTNKNRQSYFLYELNQDGYQKIASSVDPTKLDDRIWNKLCR